MRLEKLLIITPDFPDELGKRMTGIFIKEQVKYLKDYFRHIYVISPSTVWREYIQKEHYDDYIWDNVEVHYPIIANLPFPYVPKHLKRAWLMREKREIEKFIKSKSLDFDLIHAHYTWYPGSVATCLKKNFDVPVVITEHTSLTLRRAMKGEDPCFLNTWAKCDAIIRVNKCDIPQIKQYNGNTVNIPNGYDAESVYPLDQGKCRDELNIGRDAKVILSIGRLSEEKGHSYLVQSMKRLIKTRRDLLCIIIGPGPLEKKLLSEIDSLGLKNFIKLEGFVPKDRISLFINSCDLFVHPSLIESFGIVQIEAMACGKPVVATYNGGSEDIIISEDYGYLVEPRDPEGLAEKIALALDRDWDAQKIQKYARDFSWSNVAKQIISLYEDIERRWNA